MDHSNAEDISYFELPIYAANADWAAGETWVWRSTETGETLTMTVLDVGDLPFRSGRYLVVYHSSAASDFFLNYVRRSGLDVTEADLKITCQSPCDGDWERQLDSDGSDSQGFLFMPFPIREDTLMLSLEPIGRPYVDGKRVHMDHRVESGLPTSVTTAAGQFDVLPIFHNYTIYSAANVEVQKVGEKGAPRPPDMELRGYWNNEIDSFVSFEARTSDTGLWVHDYGSFLDTPWTAPGTYELVTHEFQEPMSVQEIVERYGTIEGEASTQESDATRQVLDVSTEGPDGHGYPATITAVIKPPSHFQGALDVVFAHEGLPGQESGRSKDVFDSGRALRYDFQAAVPGNYRVDVVANAENGFTAKATSNLFVGPDVYLNVTCPVDASLDEPCGQIEVPIAPDVALSIKGSIEGVGTPAKVDLLDASGEVVESATVEDGTFSLQAVGSLHNASAPWTLTVSSMIHGDIEMDASGRYAPAADST